jgi:hypothetical protein
MNMDAQEAVERNTEAARRKFGINPPLTDPPTSKKELLIVGTLVLVGLITFFAFAWH